MTVVRFPDGAFDSSDLSGPSDKSDVFRRNHLFFAPNNQFPAALTQGVWKENKEPDQAGHAR